jgi:hypothetical protein
MPVQGYDAESLLRSLLENIPGAIYRAANDSAWSVLKVSDEIEAITGLRLSAINGSRSTARRTAARASGRACRSRGSRRGPVTT